MGVEPALKMFISQVLASRSAVSTDDESDCYEHGGHQFARCWLQGTVVAIDEFLLTLDDGSGVIEVEVDSLPLNLKLGVELMITGSPAAFDVTVGGVGGGAASIDCIIVDYKKVLEDADRVAHWNLEVVHAWGMRQAGQR